MIEKCRTCAHKNVCILKTHILNDTCIDYSDENKTFNTEYGIYAKVYIIDRWDVDNNCSQYGDGSGSKNIELIVRECFITSITIPDHQRNYLYRIQPYRLTTVEDGIKSHYWDQSWYAKSLFSNKEDAIEYLKNIGLTDVQVR